MPCHAVCTRTEACGCGVRTPAHDPVWSCREVSPVLTAMCYDSFERPTRQFSDDFTPQHRAADHFKRRQSCATGTAQSTNLVRTSHNFR